MEDIVRLLSEINEELTGTVTLLKHSQIRKMQQSDDAVLSTSTGHKSELSIKEILLSRRIGWNAARSWQR